MVGYLISEVAADSHGQGELTGVNGEEERWCSKKFSYRSLTVDRGGFLLAMLLAIRLPV